MSSFYVGAPPRHLLRQEVHVEHGDSVMGVLDTMQATESVEGESMDDGSSRPTGHIKDRTRGAQRKIKRCN